MAIAKVLYALVSETRFPRRRRPKPLLSSELCRLRVEHLEDRVTPSVNPATPLELDGDVIRDGEERINYDKAHAGVAFRG
jgi:hypothetical protein